MNILLTTESLPVKENGDRPPREDKASKKNTFASASGGKTKEKIQTGGKTSSGLQSKVTK